MTHLRKPGESLIRDDVIGRTLVAVHEEFRWDVNGIDISFCCFQLDSGTVFLLPGEDADGLLCHEIPKSVEPIYESEPGTVLGQRIDVLLRERQDSDLHLESLCLLLGNGWIVWHVCGAPHGTGYAGVHLERPGELDTSQLERLW